MIACCLQCSSHYRPAISGTGERRRGAADMACMRKVRSASASLDKMVHLHAQEATNLVRRARIDMARRRRVCCRAKATESDFSVPFELSAPVIRTPCQPLARNLTIRDHSCQLRDTKYVSRDVMFRYSHLIFQGLLAGLSLFFRTCARQSSAGKPRAALRAA